MNERIYLKGIGRIATGELLRTNRLKRHLTRENLSEAIDEAGADSASANAIGNWEAGRSIPTLSHLVFLSEFYRCSLDELLVLDEPSSVDGA